MLRASLLSDCSLYLQREKMALQDNQPLDIWVTVLLLVVSMITLGARVYVRLRNKTFGSDDALMVTGAFFYIFQCTTVIGGAVAGIGLRNENIKSHSQYVAAGRVRLVHNHRFPVVTETNKTIL